MTPTVLITAYAVNPYKGSEDGTGWNIITQLARRQHIIAITRRNNRRDIERYFAAQVPEMGQVPEFHYYDLPPWLAFWKKGGRGALLYHYLWHLGVVFFILRRRFRFDLAHHLNFHSDWTPSFLWLLGKPFIWGPVGHHAAIPAPYIRQYGRNAWLLDRLRWWTKRLFWTFDPFLKITKRTAARVIGVNSSVRQVLGVPAARFCRLPAIATETPERQTVPNAGLQVLSIGRFVPLKGFDITIRAFARSYRRQQAQVQAQMRLTLIGKGPEKARLQRIAQDCGLPDGTIRFVDWISRQELSLYFGAARVFCFPSHEGAGMVVPEALSHGVPVLCFQNFGPGELCDDRCAVRIPYASHYEKSIEAFAGGLDRLLTDDAWHAQLADQARVHFRTHFTWEQKGRRIEALYREVLALSGKGFARGEKTDRVFGIEQA